MPGAPVSQNPPSTLDLDLKASTPQTTAMALPLPTGMTPSEVSFLCEMELVTVVPRQRLESIDLLSVSASQRVVPASSACLLTRRTGLYTDAPPAVSK